MPAPRIVRAESDAAIRATFAVMRQLRPHLAGPDDYLATVRRMQADGGVGGGGYRLAAVLDDADIVQAVAGYRVFEMLYAGRLLSVDDLVTDADARSQGYGRALLTWLRAEGRALGCAELHLDSATHREAAHRFYLREGLGILGHHFRCPL